MPEQQLQRVLQDDAFGLPYWAWNRDGDLPEEQQTQAPVWGTDYMGGSGDPITNRNRQGSGGAGPPRFFGAPRSVTVFLVFFSWDAFIATLAVVRPPPVLPYRRHPVTPLAKLTADIAYRHNENC